MRIQTRVACCALAVAGCVESPNEPVDEPAPAPAPEVRRARLRTPDGVRTMSFVVDAEGRPVSGGDMILPDEVLDTTYAAPGADVAHWPDNVVPYEIVDEASFPNLTRLNDSLRHYQRRSAVRFRRKEPGDARWVRFVKEVWIDEGCGRSRVGMIPLSFPSLPTPQDLTLYYDPADITRCTNSGTVIHELAHALGVYHEQSREDREDYVTINWLNVDDALEGNFDIDDTESPSVMGPYDYGSIMHYRWNQFAIDDTMPTIIRNDGAPLVTQYVELSDLDLASLDRSYPTHPGPTPALCRSAIPRNAVGRRADLGEGWHDLDAEVSIAMYKSSSVSPRFQSALDWRAGDGGFLVENKWAAGDFDGDGYDDLATVWNDGGSAQIAVRLGNLATSPPAAIQSRSGDGPWIGTAEWIPGNFNNDQYADLAMVWNNAGTTTIYVLTGGPSRFSGRALWLFNAGPWDANTRWISGNITGGSAAPESLDDLVAIRKVGTQQQLTIYRSNGTAFTSVGGLAAHGTWRASTTWLAGRFNNDNNIDVVSVWDDAGLASMSFYRSNGTSFTSPTLWAHQAGGFDASMVWRAGNFDGDSSGGAGFTDVAGIWNHGGMTSFSVRISDGFKFLAPASWGTRVNGWQYSTSWCAGTFDSL